MEKNDDELFLRRITVIVKNKLEEYVRSRSLTKFARIKSLGIWRDDWVFVTTPFVAPIDHKRKGLLTPPRITALNAVLSKVSSLQLSQFLHSHLSFRLYQIPIALLSIGTK